MRYQTSSIERKTKPVSPAASSTSLLGIDGVSWAPTPSSGIIAALTDSGGVTAKRLPSRMAVAATTALTATAVHSVWRIPHHSMARKVASMTPPTEPRVFIA